MHNDLGQRWHCMNPACRKEKVVESNEVLVSHPRCSCGAPMKKQYSPPTLRYLDFLRLDEPWFAGPVAQKD